MHHPHDADPQHLSTLYVEAERARLARLAPRHPHPWRHALALLLLRLAVRVEPGLLAPAPRRLT